MGRVSIFHFSGTLQMNVTSVVNIVTFFQEKGAKN